jgi:diguanylate cyclase
VGAPDVYRQRIEAYARRIRQTDSVTSIIGLLDAAITETRALRDNEHSQLTPEKIERAELEIQSLKSELEQLRELVYVDALTGLHNRGVLDDSYAREAARAERSGKALAVALVDIDDFKKINDGHGHPVGDKALMHLAAIVRKTVRPSDVVVRYGGEEFLFLLPDADLEQAALALQRLQLDLERQPLIHGECEIEITFSAGVAQRERNESRESVIARADVALYAAKRAGKRQVNKAVETLTVG